MCPLAIYFVMFWNVEVRLRDVSCAPCGAYNAYIYTGFGTTTEILLQEQTCFSQSRPSCRNTRPLQRRWVTVAAAKYRVSPPLLVQQLGHAEHEYSPPPPRLSTQSRIVPEQPFHETHHERVEAGASGRAGHGGGPLEFQRKLERHVSAQGAGESLFAIACSLPHQIQC